jgi:hypothetical protein
MIALCSRESSVVPIILVALLALILFGVGFTVHILWWIATVLAVVWLIGFFVHPGGRRWSSW